MANSKPVLSLYDLPMWEAMKQGRLDLQVCKGCGKHRYPPAPVCANCLSMDYEWKAVSGRGKILSWVIFHKKYFDDHVPPYNAIAVQLDEGPIVMTNLVGPEPEGSWAEARVELGFAEHAGRIQHHARVSGKS
jgi:uncharacterized OB-fold protein